MYGVLCADRQELSSCRAFQAFSICSSCVSHGRMPWYSVHPRFYGEQLSSAVEAIDYLRGNENRLLTSIPLSIRGINFCDRPVFHTDACPGMPSQKGKT